MKPIVVVGSINMDLVSATSRIPRIGETVTGKDFQMYSGGKGANQAVGVARLGYPCVLLGMIGNDIFGQKLRSNLERYGVDVSHLGTAETATGTASISVDDSGGNCIIVTPGANAEVTPDYVSTRMDLLKTAGMVLMQLEIPIETILWVTEYCAEKGVPVMLDPAPAQSLPSSLLHRVTWFTPNETEVAFYAPGCEDIPQIIAKLKSAGVKNIILKRGSEGAVAVTADGDTHPVASFPVLAVDTTAAGDSFNAAFAVAQMRGAAAAQSARFAAAAAAVSVTRRGAQASLPSEAEVLMLLDRETPQLGVPATAL